METQARKKHVIFVEINTFQPKWKKCREKFLHVQLYLEHIFVTEICELSPYFHIIIAMIAQARNKYKCHHISINIWTKCALQQWIVVNSLFTRKLLTASAQKITWSISMLYSLTFANIYVVILKLESVPLMMLFYFCSWRNLLKLSYFSMATWTGASAWTERSSAQCGSWKFGSCFKVSKCIIWIQLINHLYFCISLKLSRILEKFALFGIVVKHF